MGTKDRFQIGGFMKSRSEGPNRQTMLSRPTPKTGGRATAPREPQETEAPAQARVLVVEEKGAEDYVCRYLLEEEGMQVLSAQTCSDGLRLAKENQPDVVVVDLTLPDGDGHEFALEVKLVPELARMPVVGIGTMAAHQMSREPSPQLFAAYLTKPIRRAKFCKTIRDVLGRRTARKVKERRDKPFKVES